MCKALEYVPMRAGEAPCDFALDRVYEKAAKIKGLVKMDEEQSQYEHNVQPLVDGEIKKLKSDLNAEWSFRNDQMDKVHEALLPVVARFKELDPHTKARTFDEITNDPNEDYREALFKSFDAIILNAGKLGILDGDNLVLRLLYGKKFSFPQRNRPCCKVFPRDFRVCCEYVV